MNGGIIDRILGVGRASVVMGMVVVLAVAFARGGTAHAQLLSPGKLSTAHAALDGDEGCDKCHASGRRVSEDKCLGCHDDLGRRIRARKGLHGRNYRGQDCGKCHIEHIGRNGRLIRWPSKDRNKFDHRLTGWNLEASHAKVGCKKCHTKKNRRGASTYLGLTTACGGCHKDVHDARLGTSCQDCHNVRDWKDVRIDSFNHDLARFALRGKHTDVTCRKCHGQPPRYRGIAFKRCADCHADPHKGRFKQACEDCHEVTGWSESRGFRRRHPGLRLVHGHARVGCKKCHDRGNMRAPSRGRACVSCHKPVHIAKFGRNCKSCHGSIQWVGLRSSIGRNAHPKTRYPLQGQHEKLDCGQCHKKRVPLNKRYRGLEFDRCTGCHADKHSGEFQTWDAGECGPCHKVSGFLPTTFGVEEHARASFALEGRHAAAPCRACHPGKRPRMDLHVAKKTCAECHENPHGTQFAAEMQQGGCAQCHIPAGWAQAKVDHSTWPLEGAHRSAPCYRCHGAKNKGNTDRQPAGQREPAAYRGIPRTCDGCHQDVHAGQFRLSEPVRACASCHETTGFSIAAFDHEPMTGYPLTGKHKALGCAACHKPERLKNGATAVRYRLGYRACGDCHRNPHEK